MIFISTEYVTDLQRPPKRFSMPAYMDENEVNYEFMQQ